MLRDPQHPELHVVKRLGLPRLPIGPPKAKTTTSVELSPRETEIVALIAQGLFYKEISAKLGISVRTVHFHVSNAFRTTGASNREDIVRWFFNSTNQNIDPDVDQFILRIGPRRILGAIERLLCGAQSSRCEPPAVPAARQNRRRRIERLLGKLRDIRRRLNSTSVDADKIPDGEAISPGTAGQ